MIIDRLHENSHGVCSPCYSPDAYIQVREKNTQVVEQKNSTYVQKRASLYAMGHFMFLFHLRHFTWERTDLTREISDRKQSVVVSRQLKSSLHTRLAAREAANLKRRRADATVERSQQQYSSFWRDAADYDASALCGAEAQCDMLRDTPAAP